ncbi:MAG: YceH family protein [Burkholderiaceae bacterium]
MKNPNLTPAEARVVAVLMEKQRTVPDTYPMSLSALVSGCNQKTAREPVMSLTDQDVLKAIETLRRRDWVIESSGSRVMRYEQNAARALGVAGNGMILLAVLALRGPQTVAELRANSQRWYAFVDNSSVEAYLNELAERKDGPLVVKLPRQPGARESRWAQLLCGDADLENIMAQAASQPTAMSGNDINANADRSSLVERQTASSDTRVHALEKRVEILETKLAFLMEQLGVEDITPDDSGSAVS